MTQGTELLHLGLSSRHHLGILAHPSIPIRSHSSSSKEAGERGMAEVLVTVVRTGTNLRIGSEMSHTVAVPFTTLIGATFRHPLHLRAARHLRPGIRARARVVAARSMEIATGMEVMDGE